MNTGKKTTDGLRLAIATAIAIVLVSISVCCGIWFADSDAVYAMDTTATAQVGELLSNHYETRTDGKIFNRKTLEDLYAALGGAGANLATVSALGTRDAADLRAQNGSQDIAVTFGDYEWTVTHLTQDRNGNTIVTLWLTESTTDMEWNLWLDDSKALAYPSDMYSTSYIRAKGLNSGGCGYVASPADADGVNKKLTQIPQDETHAFAIFSMATANDASGHNRSVLPYLVQPRDVAYQETESLKPYAPSNWNVSPNEAYGSSIAPSGDYIYKTHYNEWADDYLWLPSIAETGWGDASGFWKLSINQRSNVNHTWTRSGHFNVASVSFGLHSTTTNYYDTYVTTQLAVRPALHLNLTKADADTVEPIAVPSVGMTQADRNKPYNGAAQTFALSEYYAANMQITAITGKDPAGNAITADMSFDAANGTVQAKYAGTYQVELNLTSSATDFWTTGNDSTGKREIEFTIQPKQLSVSLSSNVPDGKWEWALEDAYTATITASDIESGDTIGMQAIYTDKTSGTARHVAGVQSGADIVATVDLSKIAIGEYMLTAALDNTVGQSINYSIRNGLNTAGIPRAFTVLSKKIDTSAITWQYTALGPSGNPIPNGANQADIASGKQIVFSYFGTLDSYGAVTNKLEINRSTLPTDNQDNLLVEIDNLTSSFNGTTYTDGYSNPSGSAVAHYTTKVLLKIVHDDYLFDNNKKQIELTIEWEIVKGTFDLSGVKWKYKYTTDTGIVTDYYDPNATVLEYNDGGRISVSVDAATLPLGLEAPDGGFDYNNGESGTRVQKYTTTLAGNSLEYDAGCFEQPADLVLEWEIVGKGIEVKWKRVAAGAYFLRELNCDPKYKEIVHYRYYDAAGNELGADEAGRQAIADKVAAENIGPENPQNFKIVAYLDGTGSENYRLKTDPAETIVKIGNDAITTIKAEMPQSVEYDGNAKYTQDEIQFTGAPIRPTDYTVTYYAGTDLADMSKNTKLDGAPTDAGKYVIEIEMHDDSYVLTPSVFAVEIAAKQVAVPTVKEATFNGTEYSLLDLLTGFDATLMTLDLVTTATNAGTYRATVTLPNSNYVWATADGATGSQEYELSWTIAKAKLKEQWVGQADGKQTFVVSDKYADYVQIVYEYYDADGNLVAESDLIAGQTYKVVAKLGAASAENFEFIDVNGEVTTTPSQSEAKQFVYGNDPNNPNGSGNNGNFAGGTSEPWFKIVMIAILTVLVVMMLLLCGIWMTVARNGRLRRAREDRNASDRR